MSLHHQSSVNLDWSVLIELYFTGLNMAAGLDKGGRDQSRHGILQLLTLRFMFIYILMAYHLLAVIALYLHALLRF